MSATIDSIYIMAHRDENGDDTAVCITVESGLGMALVGGQRHRDRYLALLPALKQLRQARLLRFDRVRELKLGEVEVKPTTRPFVFDKVIAFIALEPTGEGIMGSTNIQPGIFMPLIAADYARTRDLDLVAKTISFVSKMDYKLVEYAFAAEEG